MQPACRYLLISWALFMFAFYGYEKGGILFAIIPLGIGGAMRREHDKLLAGNLFSRPKWKVFTAIYYLLLLAVSIGWARNIMEMPMFLFVGLVGFPFIYAMLENDLKSCLGVENRFGREKNHDL